MTALGHWTLNIEKKERDMPSEKNKINCKLPVSKTIFCNPNKIISAPEDLAFLLTEDNIFLQNGSNYSTQRFLQVSPVW